jgi:CubicO group peptidase (beta-lactamase class C family)
MTRAAEVVQQHLKTHGIPGAAFATGRVGCLELGWVGRSCPNSDATNGSAVNAETIWDLASLTKTLVTVPLLLKLWEAGHLDLDAPLRDGLPEVRGFPLETATVTQLASHTAGLEALSRLRFWNLPRDEALRRALTEPRPETGIVYSDQGFIVLTRLLETLHGERLDAVAARELFSPAHAALTYQPEPARCACTELDETTGSFLRGTVHDENTRALDGVSGHAGLFGSLRAVTTYLEALLSGRILKPATLERMAAPVAESESDARAFGWVRRHAHWLGGDAAPADALGHTGFTGTGAWFSRSTGQLNVLLTNRVCPSRNSPSDIAGLRIAFNDAAWLED